MANRTNIIRMLKSEIEKGNTIILTNGNFVNEEYLLNDILKSFTDDLKSGKIDMSVTPDDYKNKKLSECIKATDLLKEIEKILVNQCFGMLTELKQEQETTEPVKEVIENGTGKADANNRTSRKDAGGRHKDSKKANA